MKDSSQTHSDIVCPIWSEEMLPDEQGNCSLCGYSPNDAINEIIDNERKQAWQDGHDSAAHHVRLYGNSHLLRVAK